MFGFNFFYNGILPAPNREEQISKAKNKLENFKYKAFEYVREQGHVLAERNIYDPRYTIANNAEIHIERMDEIELELRINTYPEREEELNTEFDRIFQEVNDIDERPYV